jgi:hypothetical protein
MKRETGKKHLTEQMPSLFTNSQKVKDPETFIKVTYSKLRHHMHTKNALIPEKFALRKVMSTEDVTSKPTEKVLKSISPKMHIGEIFCDLAEAFTV